ncbi:rhodanese-like domain-containing protein [Psychroflexus salis]|uniref:Rhodanese domain-containing protein n=1 Tax=Psychroflexus salis TaxID=1526574 RepID=A0A917A1C3_9FLAO|nr:rhodanese-like domain-containing protein [Psychroflexus salis]GGE20021.1 hypothetical protein GCM10010831_21420 [Psychroflexus salis]
MEILKNKILKPFVNISIASFLLVSCNFGNSQIEIVTSDEMEYLILADSVQLIDVRSFEDFQNKHIKGAQSIVFDSDFEENIQLLDKTKPVAVYCRTGRRSKECSQILKDQGFTKIYELKGGLEKWEYQDLLIESNTDVEN